MSASLFGDYVTGCPGCGTLREPLLWAIDTHAGEERTYRCSACGRVWSVEGRQEALPLEDDGSEAWSLTDAAATALVGRSRT